MKNLKINFGLFSLLAILAVSVFLTSCEQEAILSINEDNIEVSIPLKAKEQLDLGIVNWNEYFGNSVKAIEYQAVRNINSGSRVEEVIENITATSNYIPQGDFMKPSSVTAKKINEINDTEITSRIGNLINGRIEVGQTEVRVKWELDGEPFYTTAVVDEEGVVYDNMLFNAVIVENIDEPYIESTNVAPGEAPGIEKSWQYKGWIWTVWRANWIWGGERGKGTVEAGVWCWNGTRYSQYDTFSYGGYFTLGEQKTEAQKLSHSCNKFKHVWGWSTVTGSVSFNQNNFTISVSGLGSKANGGGQGGACCWGTI